MKVYALLLLVVGCRSFQWKPINDFKDTCKEVSKTAVDTIVSIEKVIDTSLQQSKLFINDSYSNHILNRISTIDISRDPCFKNFMQKENLELSYLIQIYQFQIPLQNRIEDLKERLNYLNSSLDIFQALADSKVGNCKLPTGRCLEEINDWLESNIHSFYCTIYPNCSNHSIRKRSTCDGDFTCNDNSCIAASYYCNNECDCNSGNCEDEPSDCVRQCDQFRCKETFRCIEFSKKCDGKDDCGDGTDEIGCTFIQSYTYENCSIKSGNFLCSNQLCIGVEKVCDGYNDCGDWSDENGECNGTQCSSECGRKGGVCFTGPSGSECLYECPPGTFETSKGCARNPEAPLPTLFEVIADTPRLLTRYTTRVKYLKTKTIIGFSRVLKDIVSCKQGEFTLLSRVIDFSSIIHDGNSLNKEPKDDLAAPNPLQDGISNSSSLELTTDPSP